MILLAVCHWFFHNFIFWCFRNITNYSECNKNKQEVECDLKFLKSLDTNHWKRKTFNELKLCSYFLWILTLKWMRNFDNVVTGKYWGGVWIAIAVFHLIFGTRREVIHINLLPHLLSCSLLLYGQIRCSFLSFHRCLIINACDGNLQKKHYKIIIIVQNLYKS